MYVVLYIIEQFIPLLQQAINSTLKRVEWHLKGGDLWRYDAVPDVVDDGHAAFVWEELSRLRHVGELETALSLELIFQWASYHRLYYRSILLITLVENVQSELIELTKTKKQ